MSSKQHFYRQIYFLGSMQSNPILLRKILRNVKSDSMRHVFEITNAKENNEFQYPSLCHQLNFIEKKKKECMGIK